MAAANPLTHNYYASYTFGNLAINLTRQLPEMAGQSQMAILMTFSIGVVYGHGNEAKHA